MFLRRIGWCCLLCAALLGVSGIAVASVMVPGNDGQSLPLNQIDDIMRHVTGDTATTLTLKKHSLMLVENSLAGGQFTLTPTIYTFDSDGVRVLSCNSAISSGDKIILSGTLLRDFILLPCRPCPAEGKN